MNESDFVKICQAIDPHGYLQDDDAILKHLKEVWNLAVDACAQSCELAVQKEGEIIGINISSILKNKIQ